MGIKIGLLGDVAEDFSISNQVFGDVLTFVGNFPMGGLEQAGHDFYGRAFSRPVRSQIAENLSGLEGKGHILNGQDGAVELAKVFRLEHCSLPLGEQTNPCGRGVTARRRQGISRRAIRPIRSWIGGRVPRSEEHTSELQSLAYLVCRLLL